MFNKYSNILLIFLVLFCLIIIGKWGIDYYMRNVELYNENIIEFSIELIKGNKTLEDIDTLDANDDIKESLRQYYNDTFFEDNELICIYEDMSYFRQHKDKLKEMQLSYGEEINNSECGYFYQFVNEGDDVSEEERKYNHLASTYLYYNEDKKTNGIVEKDNNLYIDPNYLDFSEYDGSNVYYEGLTLYINKYNFDKSIRNVRAEDEFFKSLTLINVNESDTRNYQIKNKSKAYIINGTIACDIKLGKIDNLNIVLK